MTTSNWDKILLLMWKNWLLQWRHKARMIMEIVVPVLLSTLLVLIRGVIQPDIIENVTSFTPVPINTLESLR